MLSDGPVTRFDWWFLVFAVLSCMGVSVFCVSQFGWGLFSAYSIGAFCLLCVLPRWGYNLGVDSSDKMFFSGMCFFFCLTYPFLILMGLVVLVVMGLVFGLQWLFIPEFRNAGTSLRAELDNDVP
jgi:hypothetical protein